MVLQPTAATVACDAQGDLALDKIKSQRAKFLKNLHKAKKLRLIHQKFNLDKWEALARGGWGGVMV